MKKNIITKTGMASLAFAFAMALSVPLLASAQGRGQGQGSDTEKVTERVNTRKEEAKTRISEKRETAEVKSQERRQEACENRSEKLQITMDKIVSQATKMLGVMDSFYSRVQGFYDKGQLTVSNYDELNDAVKVAQTNVQVEIDALSELDIKVDCENQEVATSVGAFRNSTSATKDSLRAYRKALVALISSMKAEASSQNGDKTDDSSDSQTDNETETETETQQEVETDQPNTEEAN